jgi:hypothetical protein
MKKIGTGLLAACAMYMNPAAANVFMVSIEVPRIDVAEYHRPYLAVWIERGDQTVATSLAVWYETKRGETGTRWLPDLRQWWRRTGRDQSFPVDGVTGATRPIGRYMLSYDTRKPPLADLTAGSYTLVIEAVRESGGREAVRIPFEWPSTGTLNLSANGRTELGAIELTAAP